MTQELEVRPSDQVEEPRSLMVLESIDTELIVAELEGRAVSQWAYRFRDGDGGGELTGLTVAGVEQCSRESAKHGEALRILKREWFPMDPGPDGSPGAWFAVVEVGRYAVRLDPSTGSGQAVEVLLDTSIGTKKEALRKYSAKKRRWYENPNALDIAVSKASRNAKKKLLDPVLVERVLVAAIEGGRVAEPTRGRQLEVSAEAAREALPAPDRAKVAEDQARAAFFAAARELGMPTQSAVHSILRVTMRLQCPDEAMHEGDEAEDGPVKASDPRVCHALREYVDAFARDRGPNRAAAWQALVEQLSDDQAPEVWE